MQKSFKHILVDEKNYDLLKKQGRAGDSFNDVITALLGGKQAWNSMFISALMKWGLKEFVLMGVLLVIIL